MATSQKMDTDIYWEEIKNLAVEQQQCFYELLPECIIYEQNEHKYLKQNIGYAIYGPPKTQNASTTESSDISYSRPDHLNEDIDVVDVLEYETEAKKVIDKIYNKICECMVENANSKKMYVGLIYNVIFRPKSQRKQSTKGNVKMTPNTKKLTQTEKEVEIIEKKEVENIEEKEVKNIEEKEVENIEEKEVENIEKKEVENIEKKDIKEKEEEQFMTLAIPVFTIRKNIFLKNTKEKQTPIIEAGYKIWYIDTNGRVYKDWIDYITNNNLPKCTMVVPKDGRYQPDLSKPITEDYSTVYLEIIESSACKWPAKFCEKMDAVSGIIGVGAIALDIAAMVTPVAPVVGIIGLATTGATGIWTIGRRLLRLVDRNTHEESISPLNRDAFPQWLAIVGTSFGLGSIGGTVYISKVVERGATINKVTKIAFNTMQGGNILLNGVGVIHGAYSMINRYIMDKTISYGEVLDLVTHVMFFAGSVAKIRFAEDLVKNTQGTIIDDYKQTLCSRRLRKAFNRVKRKAATNNSCTISENAEVIRYIRNRKQLLHINTHIVENQISSKIPCVTWSFEKGKLKVNGIVLIDPIEFVNHIIKLGIWTECDKTISSQSCNNTNNVNIDHLLKKISTLLSNLYLSADCPESKKLPIIPDFEPLLKEMADVNINEDFLSKLFKIAVKLMKQSKKAEDFLLLAFRFIWIYSKENLKQWGINSCYRMQSFSASNILKKIIITIFEAIDMVLINLYSAFEMYIENFQHQ